MTSSPRIIEFIPISRFKCLFMTALAALMVLGSYSAYMHPYGIRHYSPGFVQFMSMVGIPLFSLCGVVPLYRLFDKKAGLTIDEEGITNNATGFSTKRVVWNEIAGFEIVKVKRSRFIKVVFLPAHPAAGRRVVFSSSTLQRDFDDLYELLNDELEDYKSRSAS